MVTFAMPKKKPKRKRPAPDINENAFRVLNEATRKAKPALKKSKSKKSP